MKTDGAIEHPGWDLQTSPRPVCHQATQKCRYGAAFDHFVDVDHATKPGMPRIKDFPRLGHMGVMLLRWYTEERPHQALAYRTPNEVYAGMVAVPTTAAAAA
jgi:transposase InsO family protein